MSKGIYQCNNIDEVGYWFQNLPRGKYDYIQVEIIQRRKDGVTEYRGDQPESRTIRKFFLKDPEDLWAKAEDIRKICIANKARAYVYPSYVSRKKVYHEILKKMVDLVTREEYGVSVEKITTGQASKCLSNKYLMFDVDTRDRDTLTQLIDQIKEHTTEIIVNDTVNGFHVVCKPFNYTTLQLPENVELKTKCMTLLYFNGVEDKNLSD